MADRTYEPKVGDIIFFDWEGDGTTDHVGIVEKCENGTVYTVEGNSGEPASKDSTQSEAAISMDTVFRHIKNSRRCLEN